MMKSNVPNRASFAAGLLAAFPALTLLGGTAVTPDNIHAISGDTWHLSSIQNDGHLIQAASSLGARFEVVKTGAERGRVQGYSGVNDYRITFRFTGRKRIDGKRVRARLAWNDDLETERRIGSDSAERVQQVLYQTIPLTDHMVVLATPTGRKLELRGRDVKLTFQAVRAIRTTTETRVRLARESHRVESALLRVTPASHRGDLPVRIQFFGGIAANGPGIVRYTFERSDGASGPVHTVYLHRGGTARVVTDWQLGKPMRGWMRLKILEPNEMTSEKAWFQIHP